MKFSPSTDSFTVMSEAKKNERGYALKGGKWVQIEGGKKFERTEYERTEYDELNNEYIEYGRNRIQNEGEAKKNELTITSGIAAESLSRTLDGHARGVKLGFTAAVA